MSPSSPTLHMLCGKIASGKSTFASQLATAPGTVLVAEDFWLDALFGDELHSLSDYVRCSTKLRRAMAPHLVGLLGAGVSVALDFPANTVAQRTWMKHILSGTKASHRMHVFDVSDDICLKRLRTRNASGDHPFTVTESEFHQFSSYFTAPTVEEGFDLIIHGEAQDRFPQA